MKTRIVLALLCLGSFATLAQTKATDVVGVWLSEKKNGKVEVYQQGNRFYGKLIWSENMYEGDGKTSKKDANNPDKALAQRPLKDLLLLRDFVFDDGEWVDGTIYDPESGKTYSCTMKLDGEKLNIRGFIGISLFGRTTMWTRSTR